MKDRLFALTFGTVTAAALLLSSFASAQAQDAAKILKAMTDYVASQKVISATYDFDIEVVTNDLQKIQFASSGDMLLSRPNKARVSRLGVTLTPNLCLTVRHSACSARIECVCADGYQRFRHPSTS